MNLENTKAQMRKGVLEYCILSILKNGEAYPSDILVKLKKSNLIVVEGTLYPLLTRLKNAGLLTYRWEESKSGPPRKYYSETAEGIVLTDGSAISARTLVAAMGAAKNRLLDKLPGLKDQRGRQVVDSSLAVAGYLGLWSIGDCAAIPDKGKDGTCPPTAQYAVREAKHLAKNILAAVKGSPVKPFAYKNLGTFVPLGRFSGAAQIMGVNISGFRAWFLYRAYYLSQLPRLKRKIQVLIDWSLELLFRRDIVHLNITPSNQTTRSHYEPGQTVCNQGDLARGFFIILEGQIEVIRERNGVAEKVDTMGPGEYFGEIALLFEVRHTVTIRALTTLDLLVMNGADLTASFGC